MLAVIRRASSLLSNLAAERPAGFGFTIDIGKLLLAIGVRNNETVPREWADQIAARRAAMNTE